MYNNIKECLNLTKKNKRKLGKEVKYMSEKNTLGNTGIRVIDKIEDKKIIDIVNQVSTRIMTAFPDNNKKHQKKRQCHKGFDKACNHCHSNKEGKLGPWIQLVQE